MASLMPLLRIVLSTGAHQAKASRSDWCKSAETAPVSFLFLFCLFTPFSHFLCPILCATDLLPQALHSWSSSKPWTPPVPRSLLHVCCFNMTRLLGVLLLACAACTASASSRSGGRRLLRGTDALHEAGLTATGSRQLLQQGEEFE